MDDFIAKKKRIKNTVSILFNILVAGIYYMGLVKWKSAVEHAKMHRFRSFCACTKYHPFLCSPFLHSSVSNDSVCGQWRPWSDCGNAQADLGHHCPHIPEDIFSYGTARIIVTPIFEKGGLYWIFHVCHFLILDSVHPHCTNRTFSIQSWNAIMFECSL